MIRRILYRLMGGTRFARHLGVTVGENCRILTSQFGSEPWLIEIGNKVTVSSQVTFINHDGIGWLYADEKGRRFKYAKITIGDNVFIGANSIIMPGVKIGSNCIIGAGSVVTKSIPPGMIAAGNPARQIGSFTELMGRVSSWPSSQDMQGSQYKERVHSILEADYKTSLASVPVSKPQQH